MNTPSYFLMTAALDAALPRSPFVIRSLVSYWDDRYYGREARQFE